MLLEIAAGDHVSVDWLDDAPGSRRIVRGTDNQRAVGLQHPAHLAKHRVIEGDVLDNLGADQAIEAVVFKRQREGGTLRDRDRVAAQEAQLGEQQIHPHRVVEALHDDAGTASGIEGALMPARPEEHDAVAAALPVALQRNDAVEGAIVIIRGIEGVADLPQLDGGGEQIDAEAQHPGMRTPAATRKIYERHFRDTEPFRIRLDQDFFLDLEILRIQLEVLLRHLAPIETKAAGDVADRNRGPAPPREVQDGAEFAAEKPTVPAPAARVSRRDDNAGAGPRPPHLGEKLRVM